MNTINQKEKLCRSGGYGRVGCNANLETVRQFGGPYHPHPQGRSVSRTRKQHEAGSSVSLRTTPYCNIQHHAPHGLRRENPQSFRPACPHVSYPMQNISLRRENPQSFRPACPHVSWPMQNISLRLENRKSLQPACPHVSYPTLLISFTLNLVWPVRFKLKSQWETTISVSL
jgi:hypothetical protein